MIYNVHFLSNGVWCANIAIGNEDEVRRHYAKYGEIILSPGTKWDLDSARERGKPVVRCS